jgi:hypothetical protein
MLKSVATKIVLQDWTLDDDRLAPGQGCMPVVPKFFGHDMIGIRIGLVNLLSDRLRFGRVTINNEKRLLASSCLSIHVSVCSSAALIGRICVTVGVWDFYKNLWINSEFC